MKITLNHNTEKINTEKSSITVEELLSIKNFTFELLIVKINGDLVKKEQYSHTTVTEGDDVQIIHVFGGG
ncbi:MAG: sulfur carrier protein ThiS [Bacteroidales bacterium]|jgi:thiamine biosynthesis protein ThiS|nr:sulfur carrier protein ThiS [Bacteroidales bacterium]MDY0253952.1 sulfur carrier protein ThiS [Tenuifilaceae bacterium]